MTVRWTVRAATDQATEKSRNPCGFSWPWRDLIPYAPPKTKTTDPGGFLFLSALGRKNPCAAGAGFDYPARRSESSLSRRRAWVSSPKASNPRCLFCYLSDTGLPKKPRFSLYSKEKRSLEHFAPLQTKPRTERI